MSKFRPISESKKNKIVEMYKAGKSTKVIMIDLGVANQTIYTTLEKFGIELRGKGNRRSEEFKSSVVSMYGKASFEEIAYRFGCTERSVRKWCIAAGVHQKKNPS